MGRRSTRHPSGGAFPSHDTKERANGHLLLGGICKTLTCGPALKPRKTSYARPSQYSGCDSWLSVAGLRDNPQSPPEYTHKPASQPASRHKDGSTWVAVGSCPAVGRQPRGRVWPRTPGSSLGRSSEARSPRANPPAAGERSGISPPRRHKHPAECGPGRRRGTGAEVAGR